MVTRPPSSCLGPREVLWQPLHPASSSIDSLLVSPTGRKISSPLFKIKDITSGYAIQRSVPVEFFLSFSSFPIVSEYLVDNLTTDKLRGEHAEPNIDVVKRQETYSEISCMSRRGDQGIGVSRCANVSLSKG